MDPLKIDAPIRPASKGRMTSIVQEWLGLHGIHTAVDGRYGPATTSAVRTFQQRARLKESGIVGTTTYDRLVAPARAALEPLTPGKTTTLGELVVAYAEQHLAQHPREIGGQNRGPWVRLYMNGNEGPEWPWCAGFATFVLRQACETLGVPMPVRATMSCDLLAAGASEKGCFARGSVAAARANVRPGSLFLSRRKASDWVHTGIVVRVEKDVFHTIEGNTNDAGDREGYEVCARIRGFANKDFVLV